MYIKIINKERGHGFEEKIKACMGLFGGKKA